MTIGGHKWANIVLRKNESRFRLVSQYETPLNWHDIHGVTPCFSNHLRMLETAPLSVTGVGWGRWNTLISLNKTPAILEPSRSLTLAPRATNNVSISPHLILPLTGRLKMRSRLSLIHLSESSLFGNLFKSIGDPDFNYRLPRHPQSFSFLI